MEYIQFPGLSGMEETVVGKTDVAPLRMKLTLWGGGFIINQKQVK